jgi:alpha-1,2-mannosyltransferase
MQEILKNKIFLIICFLWVLLLFLILIRISHDNFHPNAVSTIYYNTAKNWINSKPIYSLSGGGFLYFPTSAVLFLPLSLLSIPAFEIIYRLISIFIIVYGILCLTKLFNEQNRKLGFGIISIFCIPLSIGVLDQGQLHYLLTGVLLIAFYKFYQKKYWLSSFLIVLSIALKPIFIPVYLIALAIFPKMRTKIIIWTVFFIALPFLAQSPKYVLNQYIACFENLKISASVGIIDKNMWAQIFNSIYVIFRVQTTPLTQLILRVGAALLCYLASIYALKNLKITKSIPIILTFCIIYILLFNPRTENNDYILIIPLMGYYLTESIIQKQIKSCVFIVLCFALIALNHGLVRYITPNNNIWLKPMVTAVFGIYLLIYKLRLNWILKSS